MLILYIIIAWVLALYIIRIHLILHAFKMHYMKIRSEIYVPSYNEIMNPKGVLTMLYKPFIKRLNGYKISCIDSFQKQISGVLYELERK